MSLLELCLLLLFAFYAACVVWVAICWHESAKADGQPGDPDRWDARDDLLLQIEARRRETDQ